MTRRPDLVTPTPLASPQVCSTHSLGRYRRQTPPYSPERPPAALAPTLTQACRIWFKLSTKYGGDVSKVTDCARISLEFATTEGLERAATFMLQEASTFKNRVANPTDEGYRDLMFTVLIGGHVCEVRAAPPSPAPFALPPAAHHHPPCVWAGELGGGASGEGRGSCGGVGRTGSVVAEGAARPLPRHHALTRCHVRRRRRRCSCTWWR